MIGSLRMDGNIRFKKPVSLLHFPYSHCPVDHAGRESHSRSSESPQVQHLTVQ